MNKLARLFILVLTLLCFSCKRDKPAIPEPLSPIKCFDKFIGEYIVYDTISGISWTMTIAHDIDTNFAGYETDFLTISNFNNEFDLHYQFSCCSPNPLLAEYTCLSYDMHPCVNYLNNRFNIHDAYDDTLTTLIENRLSNDTIILYFRKENTAYWIPDGVIYEDNYHKHIAVKQN
jgi:hypothetical protein